MRRIRTSLPSPSMALAFVALLVALGGTSYAVVSLPAKSVGAKQLKRNAVTKSKIRKNAVNGSKVRRDTLGGEDIDEGDLAEVAAADEANSATFAETATSLAQADLNATTVLNPADEITTVSASCDPGLKAVSAGVRAHNPGMMYLIDLFPATAERWTARVSNFGVDGAATLVVNCARVNSVTGP